MLDLKLCARVKRVTLSADEQSAFWERALQHARQSGLACSIAQLEPLALSDQTQTYRIRQKEGSTVLKMLSPETASVTTRVHSFFSRHGIAFPRIL